MNSPGGRPARVRRWDNLENKQWDSMGLLAKVGHGKLLISLAGVTPSTGTKTTFSSLDICVLCRGKRLSEDQA
jgi:hypothetical protein